MDPPGARLGEGDRDRDGVVAVDRLVVVAALVEPDRLAAPQIDGRVQLGRHVETRAVLTVTKLPSSASPALADFSGWNCVAKTFSRRNAALTGPP